MQYTTMVRALDERLGDTGGDAEAVLTATVQALSESAWQEAADLRAQLPKKLENVTPAGPGGQRSLDEFVARIGTLAGTPDVERARQYAHAAFPVIAEAVSAGQLRQIMEALPKEYGELAPAVSGLSGNAETLLAEVRQQASLETMEQARALTETVLVVLAEATSEGQAAQLAAALPEELADFLRARDAARHTDPDQFLAEVAARSTVSNDDTARDHTGAVFGVLRQWAPEQLGDALGQLPKPLARLAG